MPALAPADPDLLLAEDMGRFFDDPLGFVIYAYPWDTDKSIQVAKLHEPWSHVYNTKYGPDAWACEMLDEIGRQVRLHGFNGQQAVDAIRMAIASGHGIGKSAFVAWLVNWIASTRPHSVGTVTANTGPQLETKTWAQIAKWTKICITAHWFKVTTHRGSMKLIHKKHPETWFCSAQTCREENSEAFAGQHSVSSTSYYIFDEASAVPDEIKNVSEGGLTDGEPMMFAFGNPTRNSGWFKDCFTGKAAHRWTKRQIDSRSVQITNKKFLDEMIQDHGIDSDMVKIHVRGMFPSMSAMQFISTKDLDGALGRHVPVTSYNWAPKIISVDPAWQGDDKFVIGMRQGLVYRKLRSIGKNDDDVAMANLIAQLEDEHQADAVFIDGGFGTGIYSVGKTVLKRTWLLVWFAGESTDPGCLNKRAQMYKEARDWLKAGGSIPDDDKTLYNQLAAIETVPRADGKIQLESKKDMKHRGLESPDEADAFIISFAYPVQAKPRNTFGDVIQPQGGIGQSDWQAYDPLNSNLS